MKATSDDITVMMGYQEVRLKSGQFVFGRKRAAAETGLSEQTVRTCLDCLRKMGSLNIESTNNFSILTIEKWDLYQGEPDTNNESQI
jgi:biotin operon repressor